VSSRQIYALSGNADGTFWAAGENGYTMRWNGNAFQGFSTHSFEQLNGIWVGPSGEAWVAGKNGVILHHR
jgi:ligand-binding sensor domain-containing protein